MATVSKTSSDGRYTIVDTQAFASSSDMDDAAYGSQTVTLINNITGSRKTLYEYSGVGGGSPMHLSFSRDSKSAVFQTVTGWDFVSYNGKYNYRV